MQEQITAGFTLDFVTATPDYPASAGWTLKHRLMPHTVGITPIDLSATATGDDHRTTATAATTATWTAGIYAWVSWAEKGTEKQPVDAGEITVKANPLTATSYDTRSTAQKALADAEAALANFQATGGRVKSYSIGGRSMEFDDAAGLLRLVSYWKKEVARELAAAADAKGQPSTRRIYLRATNA
jgi:hypothetical protein